ncbi:MAG: hypothetical protein HC888_19920 [Candidatus Competibacteraceae bacterium]|nr:hypothetical protein [Candidatus Competibacteraceae bacterium]
MNKMQIDMIKVEDLHFDRHNPRLAEYAITNSTPESEILVILWDIMDVLELVLSISASGFFPHEALIAAKEGGKFVVIEGNRRLAAVKVLLDPELSSRNGWSIPKLKKKELDDLKALPVAIGSREDCWRFLGFKHVNGPSKWSSYAKANYIADVHSKYNIPLSEIAEQIGDRHRTVQRLYRGLMILQQAERAKLFDRNDRFRTRLSFSHLYTGVEMDGISDFLSISPQEDESKSPVPKGKRNELGEFLHWLYGSKKQNLPPLIESQNPDLRRLNAVLKNRQSIAAIRGGESLAIAYELSRPTSELFEEALLKAKRELVRVRAQLTEGYDGNYDLLDVAATVSQLSDDIFSEMQRKHERVTSKGSRTKARR